LETVAREQGMEERVIDLRRRLSDGRRLLLEVSADKDACELQLTYLKVASDNVRSHLSYVKVDITQGRGG
jgi:hypothetical protein